MVRQNHKKEQKSGRNQRPFYGEKISKNNVVSIHGGPQMDSRHCSNTSLFLKTQEI